MMGRTPFHQTLNELEHHFSNIERTPTCSYISNALFLASNEQTSNMELSKAFTRFIKLLIELTQTSYFKTCNKLEHVHLLAIELIHPIFSLEQLNIELRTYFDAPLSISLRSLEDMASK